MKRLPLLLALLACHSTEPADRRRPLGDSAEPEADPGQEDSGDPARDSGDPVEPTGCPVGMAPVPPEDPAFCIDIHEGSAEGGIAASVPGVLPLVGLSFDEARALCEATPALDESGVEVGRKRLASLSEWRDAADGQPGPGGSTYPYGEDWQDGVCATLDADGTTTLDGLQPTGSFSACQSAFGVHDTLGNAWEWVDPGLSVDIESFLSARAAEGLLLEVDEEGRLLRIEGDPSSLAFEIAGLTGRVSLDGERVAGIDVVFQADEGFRYRGYLLARSAETEADAGWMLPVEVIKPAEPAERVEILVLTEEDGAPVTAKVGCAWYTGGPGGCKNEDRFLGHLHDFTGTIGLRCAADPIP